MAKQTKTTAATRTVTTAEGGTDYTKNFTTMLKAWPVKFASSKINNDLLTIAASSGMRTGTAKHAAVAMMLRAEGATQGEMNIATGDTNYAAHRDALKTGLFVDVPCEKRVNGQPDSWGNKQGHKCFKLALKPAPKPKAKKAAGKPAGKQATASKGNGKGKAQTPTSEPQQPAQQPASEGATPNS
jgi:hypothetical protein